MVEEDHTGQNADSGAETPAGLGSVPRCCPLLPLAVARIGLSRMLHDLESRRDDRFAVSICLAGLVALHTFRYFATASGTHTMKIAVNHARLCHNQWETGPPSKRARTVVIAMETG